MRFFSRVLGGENGSPNPVDMEILRRRASVLSTDRFVERSRMQNYAERGDEARAEWHERRMRDVERRLRIVEQQLTDLQSAADEYDALKRSAK